MSDIFGFGALATGLIGAGESAAQREAALNQAAQAYNQYSNIGLPPDLSKQLALQQLKSQGILSPQLEQQIQQNPSLITNYQPNQQYLGAQQAALQSMLQRGQGGLTPSDIASYNQILGQNQQAIQGNTNALMQQYAARGQGGSGAELAAELSGQQQGAQNLYNSGLQIGGQANQNALQAMSQAGQLGGQLSSQDFQIAQQKAAAQDAINRFNTQNALGVQNYNVGAQNAAQQANLQNSQRIADYNTLMGNQEQQREANAQQQYWNNLYNLAGSKANALLGQANLGMQNAAATGQAYTNVAAGVGKAGQAFSPVFATPSNSTSGNNGQLTDSQAKTAAQSQFPDAYTNY